MTVSASNLIDSDSSDTVNATRKLCIFTGEPLADNTHAEHILQNFTGATWTSNAISCNRVQDSFGHGCDEDMEKSFRYVRNLIGASGNRKTSPRGVELKSEQGHKYLLKNSEITLREPILGQFENIDARTMKISAIVGKKKDLEWAEHEISKQLPHGWSILNSEIEEKKEDIASEGLLSAQIVFGGEGCLKGILKSCFNLLGVKESWVANAPCFSALRSLLVEGNGMVGDFCRFCKRLQPLPLSQWGKFDHHLFVYSNGRRVYGFARMYGQFMFAMKLSDDYVGKSFRYGYHVDPFVRHDVIDERNVIYKVSGLPKFEEQPIGMTHAIQTAISCAFERILHDYAQKPFDDGLRDAINRVFNRHQDEQYVTEEMGRELVDEVMNFIRPYISAASERRRLSTY